MTSRPLSLLLVPVALLATGIAVAGKTGPGIEERPAVTAGAAASATAMAADVSVTVFEQFQQYQAQIETLTGRVEELEHALSQAREQERARYVDLDGRLKALEQAPKAAAPVAAAPAETVPAQAAGDDEKVLFERGRGLVRDRKYDDAIVAFEQQLKQFPRGELVPNAMFWLGQMWLAASQPDAPKAGRYFYRVYNEYPKSSLASNAMYQHGIVQCQDDVTKGRVTLNRVIVQYPGSPDAKLADNALKQQCR